MQAKKSGTPTFLFRSYPAHRSVGTDDAIFRLSPNDR